VPRDCFDPLSGEEPRQDQDLFRNPGRLRGLFLSLFNHFHGLNLKLLQSFDLSILKAVKYKNFISEAKPSPIVSMTTYTVGVSFLTKNPHASPSKSQMEDVINRDVNSMQMYYAQTSDMLITAVAKFRSLATIVEEQELDLHLLAGPEDDTVELTENTGDDLVHKMDMRRIVASLQAAPSCSRSSTDPPLVEDYPVDAPMNTRKKGVPTEKECVAMREGLEFYESTLLMEVSVTTNTNPPRRKTHRRSFGGRQD